MPFQRRTQTVALICIAVFILFGTLMQFGLLNTTNSSRTVADSNQTTSPLELTDKTVFQAINGSPLLVLDFYYPGCGNCEYLNKITSELSNDLQGQIRFGKMNEKTESDTAKKYKITSYPTLLFFKDGILLDRIMGNISKSDLLGRIKEFKPDLNTTKVKLQVVSPNSIPLSRFGESNPSMPVLLSDDNLDLAIKKYPYLVVNAYAQWCEYCHYLNTTISELSRELEGQVAFGLIDGEKNDLAIKNRYNLTSYPALLIYRDGKMVDKLTGNLAKSTLVSELKKYYPNLNTSMIKITQPATTTTTPSKPKQTTEQACANTTKSDQPLLEAFVVSRSPFGLQMQRIMAEMISKLPQSKDYLKVRYIGSIANQTITSMHGNEEAQENLRQICIREEQQKKYWDYVECYMKAGKTVDCINNVSIDQDKLYSCTNDSSRGPAYAHKDFNRANEFKITGSPTLLMDEKIVSESDFATNNTSGRSPEALKELLCCGFKNQPLFCSLQLNKSRMATMFSTK